MNKTDDKIKKLEDQRKSLDQQLEVLKSERNKDLLRVLDAFPSGTLSSDTLIGGLLYVLDSASKDNKQKKDCDQNEVWQQAGMTFRKANFKNKRTASPQPTHQKNSHPLPQDQQKPNAVDDLNQQKAG